MRSMTGFEDWFHHPFRLGQWLTGTYMDFHFRRDYRAHFEASLEAYQLPYQFQRPTREIYNAHLIREQFNRRTRSPEVIDISSAANSLLDSNTPRHPPSPSNDTGDESSPSVGEYTMDESVDSWWRLCLFNPGPTSSIRD